MLLLGDLFNTAVCQLAGYSEWEGLLVLVGPTSVHGVDHLLHLLEGKVTKQEFSTSSYQQSGILPPTTFYAYYANKSLGTYEIDCLKSSGKAPSPSRSFYSYIGEV